MSTERAGVYAITHLPTGRRYIGSSSNLSKRWSRHRQELRDGLHRNAHLQSIWTRDGAPAFRWEIVVICEPDQRIALEQAAIDSWRTCDPDRGFNRAEVAGVSYGGGRWERTPEWRDAHSLRWRALRPATGPGSTCSKCGAIKDGSYLRIRVGNTGRTSVYVRCQECVRSQSRDYQRRKRGIPHDWPQGRHYNRRQYRSVVEGRTSA